MEHQEEQSKRSADTLIIRCPVCASDAGETLGVTGFSDGRLAASVIMQCDQCATIYLSPPPHANGMVNTGDNVSLRAYARSIEDQKRRIPANTRFLLIEEPEAMTFRRNPQAGLFDLILLPLTVESTQDPAALLKHVAGLLDKRGQIDVVIGNADSSCCNVFKGRHWFSYRFPNARQFLGQQGIKVLAEKAGLKVANRSSVFAANGWLLSMRNWLSDWGFNTYVISVMTGRWLVPWFFAALIESVAVLRDKASVLVVRLEKA